MATWGGSTAQSVDSNEGESDEGEYDNNYEGDTTLQHTGMGPSNIQHVTNIK